MNRLVVVALAGLLVIGLWVALAHRGAASVQAAPPTAAQVQHALDPTDPAADRASLQRFATASGRDANDPDVAQHLGHLAALCHQNVPTTSDQVIAAWTYTRTHGHADQDLFELLTGIESAVEQARTTGVAGMSCVDTGAAVVNMMGGAP